MDAADPGGMCVRCSTAPCGFCGAARQQDNLPAAAVGELDEREGEDRAISNGSALGAQPGTHERRAHVSRNRGKSRS
jgi:hypothetical protein